MGGHQCRAKVFAFQGSAERVRPERCLGGGKVEIQVKHIQA